MMGLFVESSMNDWLNRLFGEKGPINLISIKTIFWHSQIKKIQYIVFASFDQWSKPVDCLVE